MDNSKYTKGKWEIMNACHFESPYIVFVGEQTIVQFYNTLGKEDAKANAKLISKAPEMLEMLNKCKDALYELSSLQDGWDEDIHELKKLIKEATTI